MYIKWNVLTFSPFDLRSPPHGKNLTAMKPPSLLRCALACTLTASGVVGFQYPDCVNGPLATNTVCDTTASPPVRAAALVKAMNIGEKLSNLVEYVLHSGISN